MLVVDGKAVVASLKNKAMTFNEFWEEADVTVIDDAYRRAARIFSPDVSRTYVEYLAGKVADREEDAEEYLEAIMEARVTVAGMGLVMEVQDYFDGEADRLAKAWLAEYTPQIKSLKDERKEAYRQIVEMSTEPQDVDLVRPANKFEMTGVREGEKEADLPVWKHHLLCDENGIYPALLNHWETKVLRSKPNVKDLLSGIVIHSTQGSRHWESLMLKLNSTRLFVPISCSLPNRMAKWLWTGRST